MRPVTLTDSESLNTSDIAGAYATDSCEKSPHVAILMCTYNGDQYIQKQFDSIYRQTHQNFSLWISDDGSQADFLEILRERQALAEKADFHIVEGPRKGFAANFLSVICRPEVDAEYYAFCDQDDIWEQEKLSVAIKMLGQFPKDEPSLYGSRTHFITNDEVGIGLSPSRKRDPSFANALVQSLAGGNTMVLNRAARDLLCAAGQPEIVSHDWWSYMLVTGAGGHAVYDPEPKIFYRQHETNLVGENSSIYAQLIRMRMLLNNRFKTWNDINVAALEQAKHLFTKENKRRFEQFKAARTGGLRSRLRHLRNSGVHRQTLVGNLGLYVAALTRKI